MAQDLVSSDPKDPGADLHNAECKKCKVADGGSIEELAKLGRPRW